MGEMRDEMKKTTANAKWSAGALALYMLASYIFLDHGNAITTNILGFGEDPSLIMWFFKWWPWAIAHHLNLLHTNLVWQPLGMNLAWTTNVPLLAFFALPITLLAGPVVAYNLATLMAPVLAGWATYFLCLRLSRSPAAAIAGGYLFAFSSYEMAETLDHLNLDFTVFIPLLLLFAVKRVQGDLNRLKTVPLLGLCMTGQFLISVEISITAAMFGTFAWLISMALLRQHRPALVRLGVDACLASLMTAVLVSPLLFAMFMGAHDLKLPFFWPFVYANDLASFLVPTFMSAVGGMALLPLTRHFSGFVDEQGAYIGLPLLAIIGLFGFESWRRPHARVMLIVLLVIAIASLGPQLWLAGHFSRIVMPWYPMVWLPYISSAEPDRFSLYIWLLIAIIVSLWLARAQTPEAKRLRFLFVLLACAVILPAAHPIQKVPESTFFKPGRLESVIGLNRRVLILPFGIHGHSTYWQQENDFGFSQTGGYLGYPPRNNGNDPAVKQLMLRKYNPSLAADLQAFCARTNTQFVIVGAKLDPPAAAALAQTTWPHRQVDDVTIYTVPLPPRG